MKSQDRKVQIRKAILRTLDNCGDYMMPEPALIGSIQGYVSELLLTEIEAEIRWLELERMILGIHPAMGGSTKWKISDIGRGALAEL